MLFSNIKLIEVNDWDELVEKTYQRPYSFQQQDDCKEKQLIRFTVPYDYNEESEMNDDIPETLDSEEMGVKFATWLARDPNTPLKNQKSSWELRTFWERNFYPCFGSVVDDLHKKGLIDAGEYYLNIDW